MRTLANYAWKLPLVKEAVQELTNVLYLDSSIELRGPIDEIREMLAGEGYFFTTQVRSSNVHACVRRCVAECALHTCVYRKRALSQFSVSDISEAVHPAPCALSTNPKA